MKNLLLLAAVLGATSAHASPDTRPLPFIFDALRQIDACETARDDYSGFPLRVANQLSYESQVKAGPLSPGEYVSSVKDTQDIPGILRNMGEFAMAEDVSASIARVLGRIRLYCTT
jgi:hypothetical protein